MSTRNAVLWLSLVVLSLAIGIRAEDKEDKANCSNATLRGSYGFHATGHVFAAVARFTFDGKGGLTGTLYGRTPGNPFGPVEFTGTYSGLHRDGHLARQHARVHDCGWRQGIFHSEHYPV